MLTQSEADNLSRRVMFLEKDRARMCERIKKLEERLDALCNKDVPPCVLASDGSKAC